MPDIVSTIKSVWGTVMAALKFWEGMKAREKQKHIADCIVLLIKVGDKQKKENIRFYEKEFLAMQIVNHPSVTIDEVLDEMKKNNLAREAIGLNEFWEISPFVSGSNPWGN